jgi:PAS domain S-box-containing protein
MTADESSRDQEITLLANRLAVAEETLRALRAGEVDAIVMDTGQGEQQIYTLETEERPYRHLVERMSEGAALADTDGLIVYANQRLATLLGVPLERVLGQPFSDWLDESERSRFIRRLATATSGEHAEHTLRRSDGGSVPVLVGVSITQEPDAVLRCLTVTDLSAQKAQQQQMDRLNAQLNERLTELREVNGKLDVERNRVEQANTELQEVNEAIRGFTAAIAHDLRSPLGSIVGFSELLTKSWETFTDEKRQTFVASINRQALNLSMLVDELSTSSSIEGGVLNTSPELIVLAEAIERFLELGSGDTGDVAVSCSGDLIVWVDPQHLKRILDNYLQNALKYGAPPVRIEATRVGDMVEVRVLDHGTGVPPEFVSRLFGKFTRAETPATKAQKGTGLGLSIVRGLAEANGGQARYEPNVPNGSCFVVELPAGDVPGAQR